MGASVSKNRTVLNPNRYHKVRTSSTHEKTDKSALKCESKRALSRCFMRVIKRDGTSTYVCTLVEKGG
jgi:hypothetical protein